MLQQRYKDGDKNKISDVSRVEELSKQFARRFIGSKLDTTFLFLYIVANVVSFSMFFLFLQDRGPERGR